MWHKDTTWHIPFSPDWILISKEKKNRYSVFVIIEFHSFVCKKLLITLFTRSGILFLPILCTMSVKIVRSLSKNIDPWFELEIFKQFGYIEYTLWDKIVPPANNWDHLLDSISESLFILFYPAWRDSRIYARRSLSSMRESEIKLCHILILFIIEVLA